jgi:Flp pilus assembly pilin Flp
MKSTDVLENAMETIKNLLIALHTDEDGAGATEYIILLILIACVVIVIVKAFGATVSQKFSEANSSVSTEVTF